MPKSYLSALITEGQKLKDPAKAKILQRFFKTGKGEYGEGDIFLGITVPKQRILVKRFWQDITLKEVVELLKSKIHEHRLMAVLILVEKFNRAEKHGTFLGPNSLNRAQATKKIIYELYLKNTRHINNWDLVDSSAHKIVGAYLQDKNKSVLLKLAKSKNLWERRIAIISTFYYISRGKHEWTLKISDILLKDEHDLIHKAVGWALREAGKKCGQKVLTEYLDKHVRLMPRVALRYSIERLPQNLKRYYLKAK